MPLSVHKLASRLTFRQLQVYKAVYDLRSYSQAGDLLGLTQPAVSSQVRQLEQALGIPLFEYIGRKLYTTAAGERMHEAVVGIFAQIQSLQTELAALEGRVAGDLRITAVNTAQYVIPYLLRPFIDRNPDVRISVMVVNRATAIERLSNNLDDLVIMGMVPDGKGLVSIPFLENELIAVAPAEHPLLRQPSVTAEDFLNSQLLMREAGSGSRLALEVHCHEKRLKISDPIILGSNDAIKHAVIAGLGVAVLPKLSILPELQLGTLQNLDIEHFPLRRSWCLVHPANKNLTPAARAFIEHIQKNTEEISQLFDKQSHYFPSKKAST
ncbi:MAG: LysR family transcriptional regulator [Thalassolituus sp.]|jgi:DNA-binding transcriptional LysR family regulator|nr:LysR family transcriptional regulator [Pseudomonadota bacterium]MEC8102493.1 LysR family transcriptional regulator [Pseudomonadota bacterium]TNC84941.1 MAG: LysR family transcriptional regulator [Thalassolituus sp.]